MIKAAALYIVIVIALVMAVLCSSLIAAAYFYRQQYSQTLRANTLQHNLSSGISILLESSGSDDTQGRTFSLFGQTNDTVHLQRQPWGLFDVATVKAFIRQDTLKRAFTMAHQLDSAKWAALYVIDEDRSLSVSGKTVIRGDAYLPKAGIREAYVNNQAYQGDKRIVQGLKRNSGQTLPPLLPERLAAFRKLQQLPATDTLTSAGDSHRQSFFAPAKVIYLPKRLTRLSNLKFQGHIILYSDSTLILDSTVKLNNVLIYAKGITLKKGFQGQCQLFASDSIQVEQGCRLTYPSCLGILNNIAKPVTQPKISLGEGNRLWGTVFIYQQTPNLNLPPLVALGKRTVINGQIYVPGLLNYQDGVIINGSTYVHRFLYQTDYTRYENYLIGLHLDAPALSRYYLTSSLLPAAAASQRILQWVE